MRTDAGAMFWMLGVCTIAGTHQGAASITREATMEFIRRPDMYCPDSDHGAPFAKEPPAV